jgi:hypothetical protein
VLQNSYVSAACDNGLISLTNNATGGRIDSSTYTRKFFITFDGLQSTYRWLSRQSEKFLSICLPREISAESPSGIVY